MKTQLKRLLALNLALILLLCAALPASAASPEPAQPQQTAQPTEDSTQPQTTDPNPGTHTLTINGETHIIDADGMSRGGWTASACLSGDGQPVLALTLRYYSGDAITISANGDASGSIRPIVMLRFIGHCNIRGRQDSAALSLSGYRGLVVMMDESTVAGSSALSIGGNPAISIPDGWVRLDSSEITITGWSGDPAVEARNVICDLPTYKTRDNGSGGIWFISTAEPRTVTVKGNGGINWNGTTDDLTLTCEENSQLDLANAFTQSKKYVAYYQGDDGQTYSPFLIYPDLKPGNTVLTAVWADCDYEIPAIFYGNLGNDRNVTVVDGSREWTAPTLEPYDISQYHNTPLCWENQIGDRVTQLLSGQKMPALTRPTAYHAGYTVSETGLIFCANGETFDNGWVVVQPVYTYTANENWSRCESGKRFLSWNTKPDGTGTTYANGEDVPESHNQLVWLYAQWEQNGPQPGKHTLTIDGETHTIGTGTVTGDGWEAYAFLNGDNEPLLVLALNDYKGGPIRISDPTGVGTAKQVYALVSISGTNTVTAQSGAGITAEGYAALSMERYSRTASLTVSGQPAVRTDGRLQIVCGGVTLDGGTGAAYEAKSFYYDDKRCEANETSADGVVTKLVMRDIAHHLLIGGQNYYLSEKNPSASGSGWEAELSIENNDASTHCIYIYLNGYTGSRISFRAPYNAGETATMKAMLYYSAANRITNENGPAIRAQGYEIMTLLEKGGDNSFTVSGKPAVQTDGGVDLCGRNITLDGLNGPAYGAAWFNYVDGICDMTETWQDGVVVRVTTGEPKPITITVYKDAAKTEKQILSVRKYTRVDLTNLFTQAKQYVKYYTDADGNMYETTFMASRDLELTAVWEPCDAEVPVVFYMTQSKQFAEAKVVDAAQDGWTAPEQSDFTDKYGNAFVFLCWQRQTEDGYTYLLPGQPQKALTAGMGYYIRYTVDDPGVVVYGNGEVFPNGDAVVRWDSSFRTSYYRTSKSGKILTGWNTKPDGTGKSYGTQGEEIPEARTSLVRLYAQWADPENSVRVRFSADAVKYSEEKWLPRGSQIELPELGEKFGQAQPYWDVNFIYANGTSGSRNKCLSGTTITIPADVTECWLDAYWLPAEPLVIGGQSYSFADGRSYYRGDGWTAWYNSYSGKLVVALNGYQGPEIGLPTPAELRINAGENTITAAAGKPAISCSGWLAIRTECSDSSHPSLTASAGAGAPAVMADSLTDSRAPHVTLRAGEGSTVFTKGTKLVLDSKSSSYSGVLTGAADETTLDPAQMPDALSSLSILPRMYTFTVLGGGAQTADGKTQASKQVEAGQTTSCRTFGFTYSHHWCSGYSASASMGGNSYEVTVPNGDCTIKLVWQETGYDSFLAFRVDEPLSEETNVDPAHSCTLGQSTILFVDYQYGVATAPDLKYAQASSGDLLYWYTEEGQPYETDDSQQFLPDERFSEADTGIRSGTTLHAVSSGRNGHGFYANGKLFDNGSKSGRKAIAWNNNYTAYWNATDGSQLLCWNTKPDGTGTQYLPGVQLPSDVKKLYAQWVEDGTVPVTLYNNTVSGAERCTVKPGSVFVLPEPSEIADGLRFTQWRCYYLSRSGRYQNIGMIGAGGALTVTEDMVEICATANWLPTGKLTIDGTEYPIDQEHTDYNADMWSVSFYMEQGMFQLDLHGYTGGDISFPCAASVNAADGENRINGTLSCAGTLSIGENCGFGAHPSLTITATDANKPAILMKELRLNRLPHMTLTGGANSKAITSPSGNWHSRVEVGDTRYYGKTSSGAQEELITEDENCRRGDMWQLRTVPVMCTVTIDGSGGTTASGAPSVTLQLERNEGYSLHSAGFKKQHADLIGIEERGSDLSTNWDNMRIWPQATALTIHLKWKNIGYPYIAFRGVNGILKGKGVPADTNVVYYCNSDTLTVPELVYQDAASSGDLVYWFTSEDGTETADSHCYLPGETVQEPDDTTLYAASIWANKVVLVATGTKFSGWNRMMRANACYALRAEDGRAVESWNTKPDGSGTSYAIDTPAYQIDQSTRVLYAQWGPSFTASAAYDSATGGTKLTIRPSTGMVEPPKDTDDKPFTQGVRVMLAAYQNGRFAEMVFAEAKNGVIYCTLPHWLDYRSCELKLFFTEGGKPSRSMEIVRVN